MTRQFLAAPPARSVLGAGTLTLSHAPAQAGNGKGRSSGC